MLGVLIFSDAGRGLAEELSKHMVISIYTKNTYPSNSKKDFKEIWQKHDAILFIGATGIAIRYIAPYIVGKDKDPAVMVMDDQGRFTISLLSGHLGGANTLTKEISEALNTIPVITTASDSRGFTSIDIFAKKNNYYIDDLASIVPISTHMVNGQSVGLVSEKQIILDYPKLKYFQTIEEVNGVESAIVVTEKKHFDWPYSIPYTILRPKVLNIGVGAKKNIPYVALETQLLDSLKELNLSPYSIKAIGSIDIKKKESAIIALSSKFKVPFKTFSAEELKEYEGLCQGSKFVKDTVGVTSVSCTAALKLGGVLLADKLTGSGCTISIAKEV